MFISYNVSWLGKPVMAFHSPAFMFPLSPFFLFSKETISSHLFLVMFARPLWFLLLNSDIFPNLLSS